MKEKHSYDGGPPDHAVGVEGNPDHTHQEGEGHVYPAQVYTTASVVLINLGMDQISIKAPNPKCRLFLKIDQKRYLAAGGYLSEAPDPLPPPYTLYEYISLYLFTQGKGGG